jgi:hypothetical protein
MVCRMPRQIDMIRVVEGIAGMLSIYLGYRLFCDIPFERSRVMRRRLLTNIASGTLLGLFGMAGLIAAAGGHRTHAVARGKSTATRSLKSPGLVHRRGVLERTA